MSETKPSDILLAAGSEAAPVPIWTIRGKTERDSPALTQAQEAWLKVTGFKGQAKRMQLVPASDGSADMVLFGLGDAKTGDPGGPVSMLTGTSMPCSVMAAASTHLAPMPTGFCWTAPAMVPSLMALIWAIPES